MESDSTTSGKAKPKAKGTSPAREPRKSASKPKSPPKAPKAKSIKVRRGERVSGDKSASRLIDQRVRDLGGWRGEALVRMRALILEAEPEMTEEWKWGTPVWSRHGIVCTGEAYTKVVKLTFARGARIPDPSRLFNSGLGGNTRRAIDIHEGEKIQAVAFKALVKAAVAENGAAPTKADAKAKPVELLAGGNPQIAKADGDAPVQSYIAAMPGWKRDLGKRLDALVARNVSDVRRAVKWNSPFYGVEGRGWFLSFHVFARNVNVTFFRGTSLRPVPPGGTGKDARWIDVHEDDLDEAQMASWVKQAAALPGWLA
jgi:hypothetical protein